MSENKSKSFPSGRLSYNEKIKDDFQWAKNWIDLIDTTYGTGSGNWLSDQKRMEANYKLFNNELDQSDLKKECNPFGFDIGQIEDDIQPYNKAYNKINVMLGEEYSRPFAYKVILQGDEGVNTRMAEKSKLLHNMVGQKFQAFQKKIQAEFIEEQMAQLQESGQEINEEQMQQMVEELKQQAQSIVDNIMNPEEIEHYLKMDYRDAREIAIGKLLRFYNEKLSIKEIKNDAFKHALISGIEAVYIGLCKDKPDIKLLNPLGLIYHKSPEVKYIEDGQYAAYRQMMDPVMVLDKYSEELTKEEIERLEVYGGGIYNMDSPSKEMKYDRNRSVEDIYVKNSGALGSSGITTDGQYGETEWDQIPVLHCEWRSWRKIGLLTYLDPITQEVSNEWVDESFKMDESLGHIDLEWEWVPEIWEGTRISDNIYVNMRPVKHKQYNPEFEEPLKLSYCGAIYNNTNADSVSMMDRMKPFQYLYFLIAHKMKKIIARDRGVTFGLDASMVDPELGLEKTLYYLEELDINIYNPYANGDDAMAGKVQRPSMQGGVQRSTMQHVMQYINVLSAIDEQIGEVAGVTRQREGSTSASEAVTNVQQSIVQSSHITEPYFMLHQKIWKNIYSQLIEVAQYSTRINPISVVNILDDMSLEVLRGEDMDIDNVAFGIMLTDSSKEHQKFNELRQLSQALIQNDKAKLSDIISMLNSESLVELDNRIKKSEAETQAKEDAIQQQQQEMQQQQIEAQKEMENIKHQREIELHEMDNEAKIRVAEINSFKFIEDQDANDNGVPDQLEIERLKLERDKVRSSDGSQAADRALKEKELEDKKEIENKKIEVEKQKVKKMGNKPSK